jgi:hypothetical protein
MLPECERNVMTTMRGASSLTDEFDQTNYATSAQNVEYILNDQVKTRAGFGPVWNPSKSITAMYNWILASANRLAYFNRTDGSVILRTLSTGSEVSLLTGASAELAVFASLGSRLAFALVTSASAGAAQGHVWDSVTAPTTADKAFQPPMAAGSFTFAFSEPAAGSVSKGVHRFAVVFTTRTGYETRPSLAASAFGSSGSIADLYITPFTTTGNKTLRVAISVVGTWPAPFVSAALLMTTVQNPARYFFVPGATATVNGGTGATVTFPDIDLPDSIIGAATSTEAVTANKDYFSLYSQDWTGAGPFNPFKIIAYSDRTVWFCTLSDGTSGIFVSNKGAGQWITLASHLIQLPEKRQIITGFILKGTLYLLGPGWTYSTSDNTSLPVTWVPPQEVDGHIGTPHVTGVAVNSSLGYAFVADTAGLQFFQGGSYASRPVSYLNTPDWERINWTAAAGTVEVKDYPFRKMVLVKAPIDGSTTANAILAWDYSNGTAWDKVNYTIWVSGALPDIGALENVYNPTAKIFEIYLSRYSTGKVYRTKSIAAGDATEANPTALYDDDGVGILSPYETCPLPQAIPEPRNFVAVRTRIRGNGTILQTAFTSDQTRSSALSNITASLAPGSWALSLMDVQSEAMTVRYSNDGVPGHWFLIAGIETFYNLWVWER